jgi:hypothetical protein
MVDAAGMINVTKLRSKNLPPLVRDVDAVLVLGGMLDAAQVPARA